MQSKIKNLNSTINLYLVLLISLLSGNLLSAQEIISTTENAETAEVEPKAPTTGTTFKVDGVAAVVGEFVILDSDIQQAIESLKQQKVEAEALTECKVLDKLMEDKLYAHHAVVDSITISEDQVRPYTQQQIDYFLNQFGGSEERVLKFYRKENSQKKNQKKRNDTNTKHPKNVTYKKTSGEELF